MTMVSKQFLIQNQSELSNISQFLYQSLNLPTLILLQGNLGAGKTTLAKYFLEQFGLLQNQIKSPTYSLINNFSVYINNQKISINHLDLYRLNESDPLLLEEIIQLISEPFSLTLIEWPEKLDLQSLIYPSLQVIEINLKLQKNQSREVVIEIKP